MSFRISTLLTAGLMTTLMVLGTAAHAGDGCTGSKKSAGTATHWEPVQTLAASHTRI